jgi:hypothetical protein
MGAPKAPSVTKIDTGGGKPTAEVLAGVDTGDTGGDVTALSGLRAKMDELGLSYNKHWGYDKLKMEYDQRIAQGDQHRVEPAGG